MPKEALKQRRSEVQNGICVLSGVALPEETRLFDTDRVLPKAEGGTYVDEENVRAVEPVAHMVRHGTLRRRQEQLDVLKSTFDDRVQTMKLLLKINNQVSACERRVDHRLPDTEAFLHEQMEPIKKRLKEIDHSINIQIKEYEDPLVRTAIGVPGLGPITIAALTVYIDLGGHYPELDGNGKPHPRAGQEKAPTPSSLWKYVGLHCSSHERYEKGVAGGGNKTLRTVLWNTANTLFKMKEETVEEWEEKETKRKEEGKPSRRRREESSPYRLVYDRTKARLAISEKLVMSRNTQGKLVEVAWKDAKPCHRHGAALRAIIKHLLVDYWLVGRELQDLPTRTIYAEAMLSHTHISSPKERGWRV